MCSATTAAALRSRKMAFNRRHKLDPAVSHRHRRTDSRVKAKAKMATALRLRRSAAEPTVLHCRRCSH